jgi:glucose/arabinose dehydrogenase
MQRLLVICLLFVLSFAVVAQEKKGDKAPAKADEKAAEKKQPEKKQPAKKPEKQGREGRYDMAAEQEFYKLEPIDIPQGIVLEAGGLEMLPDDSLAVSTRRGDIYRVENVLDKDLTKVLFKPYITGLHEVLGLTFRDGALYATQRGEVTKLRDTNNDGRADMVETLGDGWEIDGDYHEYAFGSKFDKDGNIWVTLCLTGSFSSKNKYRGWCVKITPDGRTIPTCSGVRSPGGIGTNDKGDMFYTDNQGPWNGTCGLKHLKPGGFMGHPDSFKWFDKELGEAPPKPKDGSRIIVEQTKCPPLVPTAVLFPYDKMGKSASGIVTDMTAGKFGPFAGQMFVGDQTHSTVMRVFLEQIDGQYQGVCIPFHAGIGSGALSLEMAKDGTMFVGGTNRGWGSRGSKPFSLDRLRWTGKVPFEIHEMRSTPDGFELTFTQPIDKKTAEDPASYELLTYTYIYQSQYGSPEVDHTRPEITMIKAGDDGKSVRLTINGLQLGHVHELHCDGIRNTEGKPLLHPDAFYTLNRIPK